ncbi:hypothetical protein HZS_3031, partial [Henneguya salminicola]
MLGFLLSSPSVSESNLNFSYRDNIEAKRGKIDILEKEIAIHDKTIFDLKVEVRRTPPQESLEFQAELEKIKQVLTTHMEPSIEVKKEICDLKAECLTFKKDLKTKDHQIESIEIMLKTKEQELNEAHLEIEEKTDALTRLSTVIMG